MASSIDATKPIDGVPAVKDDLRTNLAAAKSEIEALQAQTLIVGTVPDWATLADYEDDELTVEAGVLYRRNGGGTSANTFAADIENWTALGIPVFDAAGTATVPVASATSPMVYRLIGHLTEPDQLMVKLGDNSAYALTASGGVEFATPEEVDAGTDATKAINAVELKRKTELFLPVPDQSDDTDADSFFMGWEASAIDGGWLVRRLTRSSGAYHDASAANNSGVADLTAAWAIKLTLTYG